MLLGDDCQAVGGVRYLLNGSKLVQLKWFLTRADHSRYVFGLMANATKSGALVRITTSIFACPVSEQVHNPVDMATFYSGCNVRDQELPQNHS
jgi:hypothetical protein